jgi:hypothetical protein
MFTHSKLKWVVRIVTVALFGRIKTMIYQFKPTSEDMRKYGLPHGFRLRVVKRKGAEALVKDLSGSIIGWVSINSLEALR